MTDIEDKIENLVKTAMKSNLVSNENWPYSDIQDYQKKTGKRFRMTREQKESGITREQAFQQFVENLINK